MIELRRHEELAELRIQHPKAVNPFTRAMTLQLAELCQEVESDDTLRGLLIWGGPDRCFSVGGDFEDLKQISDPEEGEAYLHTIVDSYQAVLGITKPVVAAVDRYAIGQGLQVALMADWRLGTEGSRYRMPELANGMPCPLGSCILETLLGRAAMLHLVIGCHELEATGARAERLLDEVCPADRLEEQARDRLQRFVKYPAKAFRLTKRIQNLRFIRALDAVRDDAAHAHAASFFAGQADAHFERILQGKEKR